MDVKQQRDVVISVKITPDIRDKLHFVATNLGQSPATVASFAIGQYVATQSAQFNAALNAGTQMASALAPGLMEFLNKLLESESCSSSKECLEPPQQSAAEKTKKPTKSSRFETSSKLKPSMGED